MKETLPGDEDNADGHALAEKTRSSPPGSPPKRRRGRPAGRGAGQAQPPKATTNKQKKLVKECHADEYKRLNKDLKRLKVELQKEIEAQNSAQERIRSQKNPYFINDFTLQQECKLFSSLIADFAANWAASGSLEHDLRHESAQKIHDLVSRDKISCCMINGTQSWANLAQVEGSTRLVTEAISAHYVHAEVLMTPFLFLQDELYDEKGTNWDITLQQALERIATKVQSNNTIASKVWQARTVQAFYGPTQISDELIDPIKDDQYAVQRQDRIGSLQAKLRLSDFHSLLRPVDDYEFQNRQDDLTTVFQAGSKLALKLHTQDVLITSWGCTRDHLKTLYQPRSDIMTLHTISSLDHASKETWPIDVMIQPAIQVATQTSDGKRQPVKTWSRAIVAILPSKKTRKLTRTLTDPNLL